MKDPFHVLVIEDNERDAEILVMRWQERIPGCQITLARSHEEARAVLDGQHRRLDCICLDLCLRPDDLDGLRTIELLRNKAPGVFVVVISGTVTPEQSVLFTNLGGIYTCRKGIAWVDLEPLFRMLNL